MSPLVRGLLVWGAAFFVLELPAHFRLVPWPTLSTTVWLGIKDWYPIAYFVALFLLVLAGHLEEHWSAGWLIAVAILGALAVSIHLVTR